MDDQSLQQLLVTNFGLSPSGYTGSRGDTGYAGSGGLGYTGSQGAGYTGSAGTGFAGPRITSIGYPGDNTAADIAGGETITLSGANFASGAQVIINGNAASVVSVVDSTTITFTAPPNPTGSYLLYVVNQDGATTVAVPGLQYSGTPTWTTPAGSLGNIRQDTSFVSNVVATGDAPVTYSVYSGTLPSGLTLSANTGVISGTTPNVASDTTYNFTIRATDAQNQDTNRTFGLIVTIAPPPLYSFTTHTFTTAGSSGRFGPTLSAIRSAYSSESWAQNNSYLTMSIDGVQRWTVPDSGTYRITVAGARGGGYNNSNSGGSVNGGGLGAVIQSDIVLEHSQILHILCGQSGGNYGGNQCGGGGGGSFVSTGASYPTSTLLMAAGGGGGGGDSAYGGLTSMYAQLTTTGGGNSAGTNGNGGGGGSDSQGAGGGGWFSAGTEIAGNQPGLQVRSSTSPAGALSVYNSNNGGFGGGAAGWGGAGGGGGYSGGGAQVASNNRAAGGGGGSYSVSSFIGGGYVNNYGNGYVTITRIV